ncbi:glycosyltransferase [Luteimonas sp BLCC-B24]|uniref:glycosyltransferase n=1 Tax=Luteimonas sp. BLCC-B24 TaxID=3025317 RepID=UPI00234C7EBE|nr:glycosyltransferase [Luteimonas sp. BLCC-B24]MDC7807937.1 glycosyltransferase [Luteimonas sp. BLCC-B24]
MEKSLLIVTEAFELGGLESYIRGEVAQLQRLGWKVHLACGHRFSEAMLPEGLASLTTGLALGPEADIAAFLGAVDHLVELARREQVSAVHAHPFTALLPAVACASTLGLRCAITLHGPDSISGSYGEAYDFMLTSLALPFASAVVAVSEEVADLACPYVEPQRLRVLENAIEPVEVVAGERHGRWLAVSRLDNAKIEGVAAFIRAAAELGLEGVDVCGDGPARDVLEASFTDMIASGQLRMLGAHADANVRMRAYAGVAGMGRVALEGLAAGLPVVLVGYSGVKGLLDDALYATASRSNLSGRGLPDVPVSALARQLQALRPGVVPEISVLARSERDADVLWRRFTEMLGDAAPVRSSVVEDYLRSLRTLYAASGASAYWSREVMDVLSRLVASPALHGTSLAQAFTIHSEAFTRTFVEQQVRTVLDTVGALPDAVAEQAALHCGSSESRDELARIAGMIDGLGEAVAASGESMRLELQSQMQSALQGVGSMRLELQSQMQHALEAAGSMHLELQSQVQHAIERVESMRLGLHSQMQHVLEEVEANGRASRSAEQALTHALDAREPPILLRLDSIERSIGAVEAWIDVQAQSRQELQALRAQSAALEAELQRVYSSSSWTLTRPMRAVKRLLVDPRGTSRHVRRMMGPAANAHPERLPRRSRVRQAWNFLRRTVSTGQISPADKARLRSMFRAGYARLGGKPGPGADAPPVAGPGMEDVFVWSVIDWHFRMQRPQHLAAAMAGKGHRVFYISNNFVDSPKAGFSVEPLDDTQRLFQVNLNVAGAPAIYFDIASPAQVEAIRASLAELLVWAGTTRSISLVQHPFWLQPAQSLPNMRLVYDCMDHHGGFEDNAASVLAGEQTLVENTDLLIVTSQWLHDEMADKSANLTMIRNATEYAHFCTRPAEVFVDEAQRRIIGYYGAIAEWFDVDLVRRVAVDHPDALVLLVGRDTVGAEARLEDLPNVRFTGEVAYTTLPYWLHAFDVCLLPFRVIPLTLATNPVKVYEYLSAGKPTVSVDLPEMSQFEDLVLLADTATGFSQQVSAALEPASMEPAAVAARQAFARNQTWSHRAADLDAALAKIDEPRVSVIVLCFNNLAFTQACLDSLVRYSDYPNLEIIAVDNASSDGSQAYLAEWAAAGENRRFIANEANLGFSAGNNVGLRAATGDYLVILNNDTYVTPGWVRGMLRHLKRHPEAGLVGPVTNNIGNEARIEIHYSSMEEMIERARAYTLRHPGVSFEMATAAFFCVMMPRQAYEAVGPMDEDFGVGFFEDDDYCRRLALKGFKVLCAEDVFVHHHLSASFNKLKSEAKQVLFEQNKAIYEAKWGPWSPHVYRDRGTH